MSRIAQLQVNPQIIWRTLGPNQYTERPLIAITIRELIQNSDDAIYSTGRADGEILLHFSEENGIATLKCRDNGCGMSEDTILDKFLCLGESEKASGSTGGFGIAKAAIIGACDFWSIYTQDNYLDSEMIGKQSIIKKPYFQGTEITLSWDYANTSRDLKPTHSGIMRGWDFIQYSDLASNANVIFQVVNKTLKPSFTYETKVIENNKNFTLTLCQASEKIENAKVYYRMNGLVQFTKDFNDDCDLFFIVDIKTDKKPQDSEYPLGPSRETINYVLDRKVKEFTETYRINNVSGVKAFKERVNEIKFFPGNKIGSGINERNSYFYSSIKTKYDSESLVLSSGNPVEYEMIVRRVNSSAKIDIFADNNRKLLYVWAKLLELGAEVSGIDKRESFGIGFILDDGTRAERYSYNDKIFYLINPKMVPLSKPQEAIPKIIFLVAHELSHSFHSDHNEEFTVKECDIFFKIYEKFGEVKWIRKFMREGIF
jgi:hypothetical protein